MLLLGVLGAVVLAYSWNQWWPPRGRNLWWLVTILAFPGLCCARTVAWGRRCCRVRRTMPHDHREQEEEEEEEDEVVDGEMDINVAVENDPPPCPQPLRRSPLLRQLAWDAEHETQFTAMYERLMPPQRVDVDKAEELTNLLIHP